MKYHKLRPFYFLPLILFLVLYGCYSVRSLQQIENLDRMFNILFSGDPLESADWIVMDSYSKDDLLNYMEDWSSGRQKAAFLILEFNGINYGGSNEEDQPADPPSATAVDFQASLLLQAEQDYLNHDYTAAEKSYREFWFLNYQNSEELPSASLLADLRNSVIKSDEAQAWTDILPEWRGFAASGFDGSFFLASCHEKLQNWEEALYWYEQSIDKSDDWREIRRSRWYVIRLLSREFPQRLPSYLTQTAPLRNEGAYFDDVFDEYYSTLVRSRRWGDLLELLPALIESGLDNAASQGYYLVERAVAAGYVQADSLQSVSSDYKSDPKGYYALRSAPDLWPELPDSSVSADTTEPLAVTEESPEAVPKGEADEIYGLLISSGYAEQALARLEENREDLSVETVAEFCRYLAGEDDLYELIRFAGYWFYRLPHRDALSLLPWVFPGADRYDLSDDIVPEEMILGVIRRESAFHEGISSRVGAGGLMQIMPSTAADLARRHRIDDWDLMNPEDNITLGTLYLSWLLERPWTESYVDVLAAYNGGGGNLRSWKRRFPFSCSPPRMQAKHPPSN